MDAPGHLDPAPAEVALVWGRYDAGDCTDTACHAGPGAATPTPTWGGPSATADCGGCHAIPPPEHPPQGCSLCHASVIDVDDVIIDQRRHVDGKVDFR